MYGIYSQYSDAFDKICISNKLNERAISYLSYSIFSQLKNLFMRYQKYCLKIILVYLSFKF